MATILIGSAASAVLGSAAGAFGSAIGFGIGSMLGDRIDSKLLGSKKQTGYTHRLQDLMVQTSCFGKTIPEIYGTVRIAGNIIWSLPIQESVFKHKQKVKVGKGRKVAQNYMEYVYHANFAISICTGEIDEINRVWADYTQINLASYNHRIYYGTEEQHPDPIIEAIQGYGKTPAYRNQAYIVFENFPLIEFGNRIPNFTFEVRKKPKVTQYKELESLVSSVMIIPSTGEFVYSTKPQFKANYFETNGKKFEYGKRKVINFNNHNNIPDIKKSFNDLINTFPNLKWVGISCSWFTDSLDIVNANIYPSIEYADADNYPDQWEVAGITRSEAKLMSYDPKGFPLYGGTPSDKTILELIDLCHQNNIKVMFYPLIMVEQPNKPWRGRISGNATDVDNFFNHPQGYNNFILHYAKLLQNKVDAFVIGSELIGITSIKNQFNLFPTVDALCNLANKCRKILGDQPIITYAADWSEYHHTDDGWYNMDNLWACKAINCIGIDAYFPLTDSSQSTYNIETIIAGFESGELYDFYYDKDGNKISMSPEYAIKNIQWFYDNEHINPDGTKTKWQPKSKPIWFTEYGFPSVDCSTNQPNVFYNPESIDSNFPKKSNGEIDFIAQRAGIFATEKYCRSKNFIQNQFLWCWDARPYPNWPDNTNLWKDSNLWQYGHWVNGKLGIVELAQIITDLATKSGLQASQINTSKLYGIVDGLVLYDNSSIKSIIHMLSEVFFFDIIEKNGVIHFISKSMNKHHQITYDDILKIDHLPAIEITRNYGNLMRNVELSYTSKNLNYMENVVQSNLSNNISNYTQQFTLPMVIADTHAQIITDTIVAANKMNINQYKFYLPSKYIYISPGDYININGKLLKVIKVLLGANYNIEINAQEDFPELYRIVNFSSQINNNEQFDHFIEFKSHGFAINDETIGIAACSLTDIFKPLIIFDHELNQIGTITTESTIGQLTEVNVGYIEIILISGTLNNINDIQTAIIGNNQIAFIEVMKIDDYRYQIIGEFNKLEVGDQFILVDDHITKIKSKTYKIVPLGEDINKYEFQKV